MSADPRTIWKLVDPRGYPRRWWDHQLVVFHPGSGDTHLLNVVAGEVLESLQQSPADILELTSRVAARLDRGADPPLLPQIQELLKELDALGLVEAVLP